jgi:translation initiation factor 1
MSQAKSSGRSSSLQGLSALADLHQAMGGETSHVSSDGLAPVAARSELLYLSRDKKKRRGKMVTLVEGFLEEEDLKVHLKSLQKACGAGGAVEQNAVLVQGDHRDKVQAYFESAGYRITRKGG